MPEQILVVDDQPEVLDHLDRLLASRGFQVLPASTPAQAVELFSLHHASLTLVILDLDLADPNLSGLDLLGRFKTEHPDVPVVILTGKGGVRDAVRAMKLGAADFLEKDIYLSEHLELTVTKVRAFVKVLREHRRLLRQADQLQRTSDYYRSLVRDRYDMVGNSAPMQELNAKVQTLADIPRPVLIRGERGTGKELVAAQIHYRGSRASRPFVVVNCAAFSGNLLESEMFGHEKGAFTGADHRRIGRFEQADGGTLFLDEIGNMSVDFQDKVLRTIEYQRFERVQGSETVSVDVRVIAATNADLEDMMSHGKFRPDLYDRLAFQTVHVPPLRQHVSDVPALVTHFLERLRCEVPSVKVTAFSAEALDKLMSYDWPGNIRQLKNVVERTAAFLDVATVQPEHIELEPALLGRTSGSFDQQVEQLQRALVADAYRRANFSQKHAADLLGLSYDQFRHYFRKFDLRGT